MLRLFDLGFDRDEPRPAGQLANVALDQRRIVGPADASLHFVENLRRRDQLVALDPHFDDRLVGRGQREADDLFFFLFFEEHARIRHAATAHAAAHTLGQSVGCTRCSDCNRQRVRENKRALGRATVGDGAGHASGETAGGRGRVCEKKRATSRSASLQPCASGHVNMTLRRAQTIRASYFQKPRRISENRLERQGGFASQADEVGNCRPVHGKP